MRARSGVLEDEELVVTAAGRAGRGRGARVARAGVGAAVRRRRPVAAPVAFEDARRGHALSDAGDPMLADGMNACVRRRPMLAGHGGGAARRARGLRARAPGLARRRGGRGARALAATARRRRSRTRSSTSGSREEKERSEAILANIADGIVAVDREGQIVLWNATAEQITGVPAAGGARAARRRGAAAATSAGRRGAPPASGSVSIQRGDKDVWLSVERGRRCATQGARSRGRIFAFRDVSGERLVEQMKSDFVAAVSHELRTPLTSIYGFAETLMREDVEFSDVERATFLGYIASESRAR